MALVFLNAELWSWPQSPFRQRSYTIAMTKTRRQSKRANKARPFCRDGNRSGIPKMRGWGTWIRTMINGVRVLCSYQTSIQLHHTPLRSDSRASRAGRPRALCASRLRSCHARARRRRCAYVWTAALTVARVPKSDRAMLEAKCRDNFLARSCHWIDLAGGRS